MRSPLGTHPAAPACAQWSLGAHLRVCVGVYMCVSVLSMVPVYVCECLSTDVYTCVSVGAAVYLCLAWCALNSLRLLTYECE